MSCERRVLHGTITDCIDARGPESCSCGLTQEGGADAGLNGSAAEWVVRGFCFVGDLNRTRITEEGRPSDSRDRGYRFVGARVAWGGAREGYRLGCTPGALAGRPATLETDVLPEMGNVELRRNAADHFYE